MKIAIFHNYYKLRGGEDVMFELECAALKEAGHEVVTFILRNEEEIPAGSALAAAGVAFRAADNSKSYERILAFLLREKPDVGHVHNWFPLFSPSIYRAHVDAGVPVVQTLHNYRLGCAAGTYYRNGSVCRSCMPLQSEAAVKNKCYRGSLLGSIAWKRMSDRNWSKGTFQNLVTHFISPTDQVGSQHVEMGLPKEKISTIPNACSDPLAVYPEQPFQSRSGITIVGRLVREKGVEVLISAWRILHDAGHQLPPLRIIGSGPDETHLKELAKGMDSVHFYGQLPREGVMKNMMASQLLVFPSLSPEIFGLGIIEAMAAGCPVLATDIGGPAELFENGVEGVHVPPGDVSILARSLEELLADPVRLETMGSAARKLYERKYSKSEHAKSLVQLFESIQEKSLQKVS